MTYHVLCARREYRLTFGMTLPLITRRLSTIFYVRPTSATVSDDIGKARGATTTEDKTWRMMVLGRVEEVRIGGGGRLDEWVTGICMYSEDEGRWKRLRSVCNEVHVDHTNHPPKQAHIPA